MMRKKRRKRWTLNGRLLRVKFLLFLLFLSFYLLLFQSHPLATTLHTNLASREGGRERREKENQIEWKEAHISTTINNHTSQQLLSSSSCLLLLSAGVKSRPLLHLFLRFLSEEKESWRRKNRVHGSRREELILRGFFQIMMIQRDETVAIFI